MGLVTQRLSPPSALVLQMSFLVWKKVTLTQSSSWECPGRPLQLVWAVFTFLREQITSLPRPGFLITAPGSCQMQQKHIPELRSGPVRLEVLLPPLRSCIRPLLRDASWLGDVPWAPPFGCSRELWEGGRLPMSGSSPDIADPGHEAQRRIAPGLGFLICNMGLAALLLPQWDVLNHVRCGR